MRISLHVGMSCMNGRFPWRSPTPLYCRFRVALLSFSRWITLHDDAYISPYLALRYVARRLTTNEPTVFNTDDTELGRIPTMRERRLLLERSRESWCLTPDLLTHLVSRQLYGACNVGNLIYGVYSSAIFAGNRWLVSHLSGYYPVDIAGNTLLVWCNNLNLKKKNVFSEESIGTVISKISLEWFL